ncbi:MAG: NAD-dependent epimerase/dehydratase family protein [Ignavibacteria bacterium]|nr:NAD-dependent epimerase/dehydratase family protein [Ignavibacteria bacterium]
MKNQPIALVTGASGFVGSHLVDLLISKNYKVKVIARRGSSLRWVKDQPIEIVNCNYDDMNGLKNAVSDCDYIFHVAGVIKSKTKEGYYEGNQKVTRNLLNAVKFSNPTLKRFVHVSSQAAVGPSSTREPIHEDTEFNPVTTYGRSKMAAEKEVLSEKENLPITICRPPAVYGPRDPEILIFFQTISKGLQPMIGFDEKNISLVHVSDLVRGILLAAENENSHGKTYFIADEKYYNWKDVGELASRLLNKKVMRIRIPHVIVFIVAAISQFFSYFRKEATILNLEKANEMIQQNWTCSVQNAMKDFGFRQQIDLETGFKETIDWYKKIGWLK